MKHTSNPIEKKMLKIFYWFVYWYSFSIFCLFTFRTFVFISKKLKNPIQSIQSTAWKSKTSVIYFKKELFHSNEFFQVLTFNWYGKKSRRIQENPRPVRQIFFLSWFKLFPRWAVKTKAKRSRIRWHLEPPLSEILPPNSFLLLSRPYVSRGWKLTRQKNKLKLAPPRRQLGTPRRLNTSESHTNSPEDERSKKSQA